MTAFISEITIEGNDGRIATMSIADENSFKLEIEHTVLTPEEMEFIAKIHKIAHERYLRDIEDVLSSKELLEKANRHMNKIGENKATFMEGVIFGYGLNNDN